MNNGQSDWRYAAQGTWNREVDGGEVQVNWEALTWQGDQPANTWVQVRARTCHGPDGASGCGGWQDQAVEPGEPLALAVGRRRYLQNDEDDSGALYVCLHTRNMVAVLITSLSIALFCTPA